MQAYAFKIKFAFGFVAGPKLVFFKKVYFPANNIGMLFTFVSESGKLLLIFLTGCFRYSRLFGFTSTAGKFYILLRSQQALV